MTSFITRVELHGATDADYEQLHIAMEGENFQRTIPGSDGLHYQLPTAMYVSFKDLSAGDVRELARRAVETTGREYWIFVAAWTDAAWYLKTPGS